MKKRMKKMLMAMLMKREIRKNSDEVYSLMSKRHLYLKYLESFQTRNPEIFTSVKNQFKDVSPINRHDISKINDNSFDKLTKSEDLRKDLSKYGHNHTTSASKFFSKSETIFYLINIDQDKKTEDE